MVPHSVLLFSTTDAFNALVALAICLESLLARASEQGNKIEVLRLKHWEIKTLMSDLMKHQPLIRNKLNLDMLYA